MFRNYELRELNEGIRVLIFIELNEGWMGNLFYRIE